MRFIIATFHMEWVKSHIGRTAEKGPIIGAKADG